jgi:hypothetical protein
MYFIKWRLINKSSYNWDSVYISLFNDFDIGNIGHSDDGGGCDTMKNIAFVLNADNSDPDYGINPPAIGFRYLQSPLVYTGNNMDTAKLPYDTLIGHRILGLTGHFHRRNAAPDPCMQDPDSAVEAYNIMKGLNGCGNSIINPISGLPTKFMYPGDACNINGWIDSFSADIRTLAHSGPFKMNISDTQIVTTSYMVGFGGNNFQNVCALQSMSDSALKYYYNDFQTCIPIGIQPISSEVPDRFMLYQNYPNPFNPSTKIKFNIPLLRGVDAEGRRGVLTKLIIYDILGRELSTLVNEQLQPGTYEVEWNAENNPSGVYFYTISSGNYFDSKKMILLK